MLECLMSVSQSGESPAGPGSSPVASRCIIAFTVGAVVVGIVALYSLWAFWPTSVQASTPADQRVSWFGSHPMVSREFLFFLTVAIAGTLGGLIHTIRSFVSYVGNRQLVWSWLPYN